jgi:hypothetical protein
VVEDAADEDAADEAEEETDETADATDEDTADVNISYSFSAGVHLDLSTPPKS